MKLPGLNSILCGPRMQSASSARAIAKVGPLAATCGALPCSTLYGRVVIRSTDACEVGAGVRARLKVADIAGCGLAVGVPGVPAAIDRLLREEGTYSLAQAVAPAVSRARQGEPTPYPR